MSVSNTPNPFPVETLPNVMRDFVQEAADSIGCDSSYVALPLIASIGRAIGNKRVLRLRRDWEEPPIIWATVIGDASDYKSPSQKQATQFLRERQNKERAKGSEVSLFSNDATYAGVRDALNGQTDSSLLLMPDELIEFLRSLGKGGQNHAKRGQWMSWWQAGELNTHRYNKKIHIPRVSMSVVGGIQPTVFRQAVIKERGLDDGFCARFLLTWQPSGKPKKWSQDAVSIATKKELRQVFRRLLDMNTRNFESGIYFKPDVITLNQAAEHWWARFHDAHVDEAETLDHDLKAAYGKLKSYAARLALIFQCVLWASDEKKDLSKAVELCGSPMVKAIKLTEWFKGETRRIYQLFGETDKESEQRDLTAHIKRKGGGITPRELMRGSWRHKTSDSAKAALDELVKARHAKWVTVPTTKRGGRETQKCVLTNT